MVEEHITNVGIEGCGSLFVTPATRTFPQIYRAAMEVGWNDAKSRLFSPSPKEWSYIRWFEQIVGAAAFEYGVLLRVGPSTVWSNIPPDLRAAIGVADAEAAAAVQLRSTPINEMRRTRAAEAWVREMRREDALTEGARLWEQGSFAEYARLLAPLRSELSPAQIKRLDIAKRRGGLL